ncbi:MAG: bis(5'-nucleosyl)-tetraphosphatase (symmetrical) YqeK [Acholeplasmataceae bacterium]|jgi:predicted HD superfamily hydrolase involved in NAD metabolism|nr:bis(5'-nucleosyl)-tetraphosphatase (symmetrical) YqeK [Acholeplasmataceae bacterium]
MIENIEPWVKEKLKEHPKRLKHVYGVAETAKKLAVIHHVSEEKAWIAGIFHDIAKYDSLEMQMNKIDLRWIKAYADYPVIYHAIAAANILEHEFRVHDQDILMAIRHHVWGRKEMSKLEKIIFVADLCEPNRDFPDTSYLFDLACKDLDYAVMYSMEQTLKYLESKGLKPSLEQLEALNYYQEVNRGKTKDNHSNT